MFVWSHPLCSVVVLQVLQLLGDVEGLRIVELGAGIGRLALLHGGKDGIVQVAEGR